MEMFQRAIEQTKIIRRPNQKIETFWKTEYEYWVLSAEKVDATILRKGKVQCAKPTILTPDNQAGKFYGFSESAVDFAEKLAKKELQKLRMLGYSFRHELQHTENHALPQAQLLANIKSRMNQSRTDLAILTSPEEFWSLSIVKILLHAIQSSFAMNVNDLQERGFFKTEDEKLLDEIEQLFQQASSDRDSLNPLAKILHEHNIFNEYEERFFDTVKKHGGTP